MRREEIADLAAFYVVAEQRSFTKAAAKLGISQSTLSQIVKRLEERLGVLLVARTTRSVAPTEAGKRLLATLGPTLRELDQSIEMLAEFRETPAGTIRITSVEHAARTILSPAIAKLLPQYPDLNVEIFIDYSLADVVADNFDAGVRLGSQVAKDMIAVRISPDIAMAIVGSPDYLRLRGAPLEPNELTEHRCINLRLPTSNKLYAWNLKIGGRIVGVSVEGQATYNSIDLILDAALAGVGLGLLPLDQVQAHLDRGVLVSVLDAFVPPLPGYYLYYANRRLNSSAFRVVVDALRYRGEPAAEG
ncbi:LysR family transcriptional regulator [Mesorhizobium sp. B4-1-1]|uniref:LysR family transcriptional regulator n=1 Tax=Mesorhizobium sp. B4-1-1 TaxID=2589890 RepID=UPI001125E22E|nr:LysR family transcriptional regulator [Mesorhizobium sp. B4-1-1]TPI11324.1 LysR family transcriptional regulator [Mesorhizobium sp. B4-1-1]